MNGTHVAQGENRHEVLIAIKENKTPYNGISNDINFMTFTEPSAASALFGNMLILWFQKAHFYE